MRGTRRRIVTGVFGGVLGGVLGGVVALTGCAGGGAEGGDTGRAPDPTRCTGTIGAETVAGDLVVPEDETCRLRGTAVLGRTVVKSRASLVARSSLLADGVSAHGFERVEIVGGRVEGRQRDWQLSHPAAERRADYVFDGGHDLTITEGNIQGDYYVVRNQGRVEVRGLYLDLGGVYCGDNRRTPRVSGIRAETPSKLGGQCAGLRNFGDSDF